jgi:EpsD family peptidyl-prolyl cis-trans isomerase
MRPIFVALAAGSLLTQGCAKKAEGQTVAVVNGEEITATELNAELATAKLPPGTDKDKARSQVLQNMINRKLLAQEASNEGIDKSPDFLSRQRRLKEDLLISMLAERKGGTAQLPSDADLARYEAGNPQMFAQREIWSLDQLRFHMPSSASVKDQIAKTKSLEALAAVLRANNIAATPARATIDSSVVPQNIYSRIAALPAGEPFIIPVGTEAVASAITARKAQPVAADEARAIALSALRKEQTTKLLKDQVERLRKTAKIDYKAGFAPPPE